MQPQSDSIEENGLEAEATAESVSELIPEFIPDPTPPAPPPGEILRKAREARGEALNDIARTLKLSAQQLEALENGRYDLLPGPTFVRGFLRNYANYLDIPPEPLLEGVSARIPTTADLTSMLKLDGNVQPAASPRPRGRMLPAVLITLAVLAVAGLIGAGFYKGWFNNIINSISNNISNISFNINIPGSESPAAGLPPPEQKIRFERQVVKLEQPVPVNIAPESAIEPSRAAAEIMGPHVPGSMAAQASAAAMVPEVGTLRVLFNASTLVQVRDSSEKIILTRTGAKGSSSSVKGKPPFSVMVRQANNVKLEFNGQAVDLREHTSRDGIARLTLQ